MYSIISKQSLGMLYFIKETAILWKLSLIKCLLKLQECNPVFSYTALNVVSITQALQQTTSGIDYLPDELMNKVFI